MHYADILSHSDTLTSSCNQECREALVVRVQGLFTALSPCCHGSLRRLARRHYYQRMALLSLGEGVRGVRSFLVLGLG